MGFIDWLTKDNHTEIEETTNKEKQKIEEEVEFDEEFDDLREIANNERMEVATYDDEEDLFPTNENYFETQIPSYSPNTNASFTIFKVIDEEDVRQVLKHLSLNLPCIATFENIKKKDFALIMKYLQGGTFVLGANMSEWQKDAYIIVPKGMTINMQEKSRRR